MTEEVIKDGTSITQEDSESSQVDSTSNVKKIADSDIYGRLNEFTEKGRREACSFFTENWTSILKAYPREDLNILAFIKTTITELRRNSGSNSVIKELEQFLNEKTGKISMGNNAGTLDLNTDSWFRDSESGSKFHPHDCARDYLRVYQDVITEYIGPTHQFIVDHWEPDAEGFIKTIIEEEGVLTPTQIEAAYTSIRNMSRNIDPATMNLTMDELRPLPEHTIPITDGLFNLKTKQISPHTPEHYYTEALPRKYIPGAIPTRFLDLLNVMFTNDSGKNLKITQIMEIFAWTFMKNYDIQGMVAMYGQGGEGKSIIHDVIGDVIVNTSSVTLDELENEKFSRPDLYGSWANLISESKTEAVGSEWFKRLTDGTRIRAARKHGQPFYFKSHAKMIADVNELPEKTDETRAFYRRVIAIITFLTPLEELLTPIEIGEFVKDLKDTEELDKIFSYVVDNFYSPLTDRMKFTGQLTTGEAAKQWEQFSNPALSFLKLKEETGFIFTDVESARAEIMRRGLDINQYITHENTLSGNEYLTTIKQPVITEGIGWAKVKGFPAKHVNAKTMGAALTTMEYNNITCTKKIAKGVTVKAWKDIVILPVDERSTQEVTDESDHPESAVTSNLFAPQQVESHKVTDRFSIVATFPETIEGREKMGIIRHLSSVDSVLPDQNIGDGTFSTNRHQPSPPESESVKSSIICDVKKGKTPFKSVEVVLRDLDMWNFDVMDRGEKTYDGKMWKIRIKGKFSTFTAEQQQYLEKMYTLMSEGSDSSPHVWIKFSVRGDDTVNDRMIMVSIMKEFTVEWNSQDWHFHNQDIVHVPKDLAAMLIERGIARGVQLHE